MSLFHELSLQRRFIVRKAAHKDRHTQTHIRTEEKEEEEKIILPYSREMYFAKVADLC